MLHENGPYGVAGVRSATALFEISSSKPADEILIPPARKFQTVQEHVYNSRKPHSFQIPGRYHQILLSQANLVRVSTMGAERKCRPGTMKVCQASLQAFQ